MRTIGVVGGGFTGTMLAVHLVEQSPSPVRVLLFDRAAAFGSGVAYSTPNAKHLLNVRVANMSAYEAAPEHFIRWLERNTDSPPSRHAFVSRGLYGQYLRGTLSECLKKHEGASVIGVGAEVTSLQVEAGCVALRTADGGRHTMDCVALCVGNFPPSLPVTPRTAEGGEKRYIANPWSAGLTSIAADDTVLVVGTGLTMVDVVLDLRSRGHRGNVIAVSRRGFVPLPHRDVAPYPAFLPPESLPRRVTELTRAVRREIAAAARQGHDWRAVVDALRPQTQALWRGLPLVERRRFMRHLRPYWEVHRHRVAMPVAEEISGQLRAGRLSVVAGRIVGAELHAAGVRLAIRRRGEADPCGVEGQWLVNCSGPQLDYQRIDDPLVRSLIDNGLARPDALSLGLDVTDDHRLIGRSGLASNVLFALGPPVRGSLWETTAVPDIRKQCVSVAWRMADVGQPDPR